MFTAFSMRRNNAIAFALILLLSSSGFELQASAAYVKIIGVLIKAEKFKIFAQALIDTGVGDELEKNQASGFTLLVPPDNVFNVNISSFTLQQKILLLKSHVLPAYYPAGAPGFVTPQPHPTLATKVAGPNKFLLNINNGGGPIVVSTGNIHAYVTELVHNKDPIAIYQISKVLLSPDLGKQK